MALNEETEAVFKSSRAEKDPVSGNDVPPGSLPEEVRDDIPAQLSEGEYVVPADVLRFQGLKFFEDLRENAKSELARMDRDGRIGGEPIAVMEISELSPEEMEELDAIGAAVGGFITQQPTQSTQYDPYQQQQMMYRQGAPVAMGNTGYAYGGVVKGYAPGGDVEAEPDFTQPTFTAPDLLSQFGAGFSFTQPSQAAPTEYTTVTLYGPSGDIITLTLPTQQELYDQKIAEGYTTEQVAVTTETSVGKDDRDDRSLQPKPTKEFNVNDIAVEDLEKTAKGISTMNNIATAIASSAGLPVAALVNAGAVAKYNDIIDRMDNEGIEHDLKKKGSIFGGESGLYENLIDSDKTKGPSFGDTWLGDLLGFDGESGVQGPGLKESFCGARRTSSTAKTSTESKTSTNDKDNNSFDSLITKGDSSSKIGTDAGDGMTWIKSENSNALTRVRDDDPRAKGQKAAMQGFDE